MIELGYDLSKKIKNSQIERHKLAIISNIQVTTIIWFNFDIPARNICTIIIRRINLAHQISASSFANYQKTFQITHFYYDQTTHAPYSNSHYFGKFTSFRSRFSNTMGLQGETLRARLKKLKIKSC